jgi:tetratricopeptide (TPR) repeat protein
VSEHPDLHTLLLYVENDPSVDRPSVAAHITACAECEAVMVEFQQIIILLSHGDVLGHLAVEDRDRAGLRETLLDQYDEVATEATSAEDFFAELLAWPIETWDTYFERHREHRTPGMARRLFAEVEVELNRRPEYALLLVGVAERIGYSLRDVECRTVLGDAWKHRSNALRHLGRYEEALSAAEIAESFYTSLLTGAFDVAQAQYTRAGVLFKMTRYGEALAVLATASATLRDFGDSVPLAKTMMLEAGILIDQGDVAAAQQRWRQVLPMLEALGDEVERARVLANLGECNLRLGNLEQAMEDAQLAVRRYEALRMEAEAVRSEWTIGMVHLARGEFEDGLSVLQNAAASFALRGMTGDAGFVKLDICEELLRREEWADAEIISRDLVSLFTVAGVTLASVNALDYLRRAVENREATADIVRYVREYVTADDPARPFEPPHDASN